MTVADVVDLEAELDRQAALFSVEHGVAVSVEVVDAALRLVRQVPDLEGLPEVVDVLGEADLVDSALGGGLEEALDGFQRVLDLLRRAAKVHVVVDDHS